MRRVLLMLLTAIAVVALPSFLQAEEQKRPGSHDPATLFKRLDKNRDGKVTIDEVPEAAPDPLKEALKRADKNHDKTITPDEFRAMVQERRSSGPPHRPKAGPGGPPRGMMHGRQGPGGPGGPRGMMHGRQGPGGPGGPRGMMHGRQGPGGPRGMMHGRQGPGGYGGPGGPPRGMRPGGYGRQGHGGPPRGMMHGRPGGPPMPDPKEIFIRLDRDKDKKLSLEEFTAGMKRMHQRRSGQPAGHRPGGYHASSRRPGGHHASGHASGHHATKRGHPMHDRQKAADKGADKGKDCKISKPKAPKAPEAPKKNDAKK